MTCRCKKACSAVETAAEEALEQGSNAFTDAVNYITPRAKQAGQHTYDYAKDAAQRVSEGVSPFIQDARDRSVPLVSEAAERLQPSLEHA